MINIGYTCCAANYQKVFFDNSTWKALGTNNSDYSTFNIGRQRIFIGSDQVLISFGLKVNWYCPRGVVLNKLMRVTRAGGGLLASHAFITPKIPAQYIKLQNKGTFLCGLV